MGGRKRKLATCFKLDSKIRRKMTCQNTGTLYQSILEDEIFYLTNNDNFFPDLVWDLVASKLNTLDDIDNFSNSSHYFRTLLRKKRETKIVLPKVFNIMAERYANSDSKFFKETNRKSITWNRPKGKRYSRMTGLWKCRLVCKSWNKAIEDLYEEHNKAHFVNSKHVRKPISTNNYLMKYAPCNLHLKMDTFLNECKMTHYDIENGYITKNPFIGRSVTIEMLLRRDSNHLQVGRWNSTKELIEKFGREIWYCTILDSGFSNWTNLTEFYHSLRNLLIRMPNLKVLTMACGIMGRDSSKTDRVQLRREILENPLPALPSLLSFTFENLPCHIFKHLKLVNNIPDDCTYNGPIMP